MICYFVSGNYFPMLGAVPLHGRFRPIFSGMIIGLVVSAGVSRVMAATLFGLNPLDVVSFWGVSVLLAAIALIATIVPARRATRVDPVVALRYD